MHAYTWVSCLYTANSYIWIFWRCFFQDMWKPPWLWPEWLLFLESLGWHDDLEGCDGGFHHGMAIGIWRHNSCGVKSWMIVITNISNRDWMRYTWGCTLCMNAVYRYLHNFNITHYDNGQLFHADLSPLSEKVKQLKCPKMSQVMGLQKAGNKIKQEICGPWNIMKQQVWWHRRLILKGDAREWHLAHGICCFEIVVTFLSHGVMEIARWSGHVMTRHFTLLVLVYV